MSPVRRRPSLRITLTLVFASVMAVVLALIGTFLFFRTKSNLDGAIREGLRARATQIAISLRTSDGSPDGSAIGPAERDAQILSRRGAVIASRPYGGAPLLDPGEARAVTTERVIDRGETARVVVRPVRLRGRTVLVAVRASLHDRENALEGLARALFIGGPVALLVAGALGYGIATAALRPVELMRRRAAGIRSADPQARLPVPAARDEIHGLATTLNEMLERLARSAEQQRSFVANAGHEIRTPIATLRAELELALAHAADLDEFRRATRAAIADADALDRLVAGLLALARVDGVDALMRPAEMDLGQAAAAAAARLRGEIAADGRDVRLHAPAPVPVRADPDHVAQALRNMTDNARIHGRGTVVVAAETRDRRGVVSITDHGPHLPEEALATAFDRFRRGPGTQGRPGAGLGLAIVRQIARAHDGEACLLNVEGGLECRLELPLAEAGRCPPHGARSV